MGLLLSWTVPWAENESSKNVTQFHQSSLPSLWEGSSAGEVTTEQETQDTGGALPLSFSHSRLFSPKLMQLSLQLILGKEHMNLAETSFTLLKEPALKTRKHLVILDEKGKVGPLDTCVSGIAHWCLLQPSIHYCLSLACPDSPSEDDGNN